MARGWHGDSQGHARAGRKGGEKVSQDREHMREIGRKGGQASGGNFANNRQRAQEAGRKGGESRRMMDENRDLGQGQAVGA